MNVDFSLDSMLDTANFGLCWIVLFTQSTVSPKLAFNDRQKAALYAIMAVIAFVVATGKTVVIFDAVLFAYCLLSAAICFRRYRRAAKKEGELP